MTLVSSETPPCGTLLAGRYRVDRTLGAGGMGTVLLVHHVELGTSLAMKLLRPHVLQAPGAVERFLREARAASSIQSDHVARVTDFGRLDDGSPFMVMELLQGEDLAQRLERERRVAVSAAVDIVVQACEALAEAHVLGIIHRDLKPANLFLHRRRDGSEFVKVLDFGISKVVSQTDMHLTSTVTMMGSPLYMSPEQLRSARTVDARSDIWALGSILYEATMGRAPFSANTIAELAVVITNEEPAPMSQVPAEFAAVVMRCLAKQPIQRFADVGALARALLPFGSLVQRSSVDGIARILSPAGAPEPGRTHPQPGASNAPLAMPLPSESHRTTQGTSVPARRAPNSPRTKLFVVGLGLGLLTVFSAVALRARLGTLGHQGSATDAPALSSEPPARSAREVPETTPSPNLVGPNAPGSDAPDAHVGGLDVGVRMDPSLPTTAAVTEAGLVDAGTVGTLRVVTPTVTPPRGSPQVRPKVTERVPVGHSTPGPMPAGPASGATRPATGVPAGGAPATGPTASIGLGAIE